MKGDSIEDIRNNHHIFFMLYNENSLCTQQDRGKRYLSIRENERNGQRSSMREMDRELYETGDVKGIHGVWSTMLRVVVGKGECNL